MPAESHVADGVVGEEVGGAPRPAGRTPRRGRRRAARRAISAAQPQHRGRPRSRRRAPARSAGSAPERPSAPGGSRLTCSSTSTARERSWAPRSSRATSLARSTDSTTSAYVRDRGGLVALEPADEVPAEAEVGALGGLGLGLLVAVLADVGDAELGQQADVGGREELGDHDQGDLVGVAPGLVARAWRCAARTAASPRGDLVAAGHAALQTTPANRPASAPSRR